MGEHAVEGASVHSELFGVPTNPGEFGVAPTFAFVRWFMLWHLLLRWYSRFKRKREFVQMIISVSEQIFLRLQSACEQRRIALPDLASDAGIALSSIYRWRSGSKPRRKNIEQLSSRLNINANWLATGEGQMELTKRESFSNARILGPIDEVFVGTVPVVSWAHAGSATSYEELPAHWQERIPTLCRGKRAFGLIVEGDSMEPKCEPNDIVIVDPDEELRNGCLVVAKLKNDGVVLRRFTRLEGERIKLIPYNAIYPSVEYSLKEFHWIYPVHSSFRRELM